MIKSFLNIVTCICLILLFYLLLKKEDSMTTNFKLAGRNAIELQKAIDHYKATNEQEKLDCVLYLIRNMYGKAGIEYSFLDSMKCIVSLDTCSALRNPDLIKPILKNGRFVKRTIKIDLEYITADFIIENIDLAFYVRNRYSWCQNLSKEIFYSTILPYRIKNEPLSNWRYFYYNKFKNIADSLERSHAKIDDVVFYMNKYHGKKYISQAECLVGEQPYSVIENIGGGTCDHLALNAALQFRAIGIPLNLDILPYHGKVNGGHAYNSFTNEDGQFVYFSPYEREPERKLWTAPIVYRINFHEPRKENVTQFYYKTTDVTLAEKGLCLATFNRGRFKKILDAENIGDSSVFRKVTCGLLYFPMKESNGSLIASNIPPFTISEDDKILFIKSLSHEIITSPILKLYDVNKVLTLRNEPYILFGWDQGWKEISSAYSNDSISIDFGLVPNYGLYLVYGNTGIEKMQRPFIIKDNSPEYY